MCKSVGVWSAFYIIQVWSTYGVWSRYGEWIPHHILLNPRGTIQEKFSAARTAETLPSGLISSKTKILRIIGRGGEEQRWGNICEYSQQFELLLDFRQKFSPRNYPGISFFWHLIYHSDFQSYIGRCTQVHCENLWPFLSKLRWVKSVQQK